MILWETVIGSHMWGLNKPDSDLDVFRVVAARTDEILKNTANLDSKFEEEGDTDRAVHEIGKVVELLLQGNCNAIWGTISPIIRQTSLWHREFDSLVKEHKTKNIYHSIHGLAVHNYRKYFENGNDPSQDRKEKVMRSLWFGCVWLNTTEINFRPSPTFMGQTIPEGIILLDKAYSESNLPDKPNPEPFRDLLLKLRIEELRHMNSGLYGRK